MFWSGRIMIPVDPAPARCSCAMMRMAYTAQRKDLLDHAKNLFDHVLQGAINIQVGQTYPLADAALAHTELKARKTKGHNWPRGIMTEVKRGNNVKVHYKGTLSEGSVFDSSEGRDPLEFAVGSGQVIADFDEAVLGMGVGESKTVDIPCAQAYGERNSEMAIQAPIDQMPPDLNPEVGMRLEMGGANGEILRVVVAEITETHITLDANPPLAGQDLTFQLELVECTTP